jgi:hypothetical protein
VSLYCYAKKVMQGAEVLHGKFILQCINHTMKKMISRGGEDDVIHVQKQINSLRSLVEDEQGGVGFSFSESQREQIRCKPAVPCTWGLLQAIKRLVETANMVW